MKYILVCLSALFLIGCSSSDDSAVSYKYQVSGTAPFSTVPVGPFATAFVIKWNENAGVITGVYTGGGETKAVTGTYNGSGRSISIVVDQTNPGDPALVTVDLPTGDLTGSVSATVTVYDETNAVIGSPSVISVDATTTTGGGSVTTIEMPTVTCTSGVSPATLANPNILEVVIGGDTFFMCIKTASTFDVIGDPSVTDGTYSVATGPAYYVTHLTATWSSSAEQVKAALCWGFSDRGTLAANVLSDGAASSGTGTFRVYATGMGCP